MIDPNEAVDYILKNAPVYAKARAERIYLEDEINEVWKIVVGFPEYEVSNFGRIKRVSAATGTRIGKFVNPWVTKNKYLMVGLSQKSKVSYKLVHRLVAEAFVGGVKGMDVCHNDGVRHNNKLSNLRVDTRKGNMSDVYKHDTHIRGERCGTNKYSESLIKQIKEEIKSGAIVLQLSKKYKIPAPTLYGIARGKTWSWL
jgi:hypothetical protein